MAVNRRMLLQVTAPALLIAVSLLGSCLIALRSINRLQEHREQIVSHNVQGLQSAQELEALLRDLRFRSFLYVMDPTDDRWAPVRRDEEEFKKVLREMRQRGLSSQEATLVAKIDTGYERYHADLMASAENPPGPNRESYLDWADRHPLRQLVEPCEQLLKLHQNAMNDMAAQSAAESDETRRTMIWLAVVGSLGGLVGGFGVAWGLGRSITRLRVRLQDVHAHLDREVASLRFTAEGSDLDAMNRQLEALLARVREVVDQVQTQEREILRSEQLAAVGQLAASVAHEVRNPLTAIKLLVSAALSGKGSTSLNEADLHIIHDEVERLERKVQDLLNFARPKELERERGSLPNVVRQALQLVQARIDRQRVSVDIDMPDAEVATEFDRSQMLSVLVNLFMNALDAMPAGGTLKVTLGEVGGDVRLAVADTGGGIDGKIAGRLFTPFVSTKPTGTGLGLSICRRIIEAHGGRIEGANRPGGGAEFTLTLPRS